MQHWDGVTGKKQRHQSTGKPGPVFLTVIIQYGEKEGKNNRGVWPVIFKLVNKSDQVKDPRQTFQDKLGGAHYKVLIKYNFNY